MSHRNQFSIRTLLVLIALTATLLGVTRFAPRVGVFLIASVVVLLPMWAIRR